MVLVISMDIIVFACKVMQVWTLPQSFDHKFLCIWEPWCIVIWRSTVVLCNSQRISTRQYCDCILFMHVFCLVAKPFPVPFAIFAVRSVRTDLHIVMTGIRYSFDFPGIWLYDTILSDVACMSLLVLSLRCACSPCTGLHSREHAEGPPGCRDTAFTFTGDIAKGIRPAMYQSEDSTFVSFLFECCFESTG